MGLFSHPCDGQDNHADHDQKAENGVECKEAFHRGLLCRDKGGDERNDFIQVGSHIHRKMGEWVGFAKAIGFLKALPSVGGQSWFVPFEATLRESLMQNLGIKGTFDDLEWRDASAGALPNAIDPFGGVEEDVSPWDVENHRKTVGQIELGQIEKGREDLGFDMAGIVIAAIIRGERLVDRIFVEVEGAKPHRKGLGQCRFADSRRARNKDKCSIHKVLITKSNHFDNHGVFRYERPRSEDRCFIRRSKNCSN